VPYLRKQLVFPYPLRASFSDFQSLTPIATVLFHLRRKDTLPQRRLSLRAFPLAPGPVLLRPSMIRSKAAPSPLFSSILVLPFSRNHTIFLSLSGSLPFSTHDRLGRSQASPTDRLLRDAITHPRLFRSVVPSSCTADGPFFSLAVFFGRCILPPNEKGSFEHSSVLYPHSDFVPWPVFPPWACEARFLLTALPPDPIAPFPVHSSTRFFLILV